MTATSMRVVQATTLERWRQRRPTTVIYTTYTKSVNTYTNQVQYVFWAQTCFIVQNHYCLWFMLLIFSHTQFRLTQTSPSLVYSRNDDPTGRKNIVSYHHPFYDLLLKRSWLKFVAVPKKGGLAWLGGRRVQVVGIKKLGFGLGHRCPLCNETSLCLNALSSPILGLAQQRLGLAGPSLAPPLAFW